MVKRDEEVIKQILEYVLDKRYCQAILIDGEWGTGKTFFVKDKLLNRLRETVPQKNIYYVSLYGAKPLTEMDTDFMLKTLDHIKVFEDGTLLVVFLDGTEIECKNGEE